MAAVETTTATVAAILKSDLYVGLGPEELEKVKATLITNLLAAEMQRPKGRYPEPPSTAVQVSKTNETLL